MKLNEEKALTNYGVYPTAMSQLHSSQSTNVHEYVTAVPLNVKKNSFIVLNLFNFGIKFT
jgi:hypothetical protein